GFARGALVAMDPVAEVNDRWIRFGDLPRPLRRDFRARELRVRGEDRVEPGMVLGKCNDELDQLPPLYRLAIREVLDERRRLGERTCVVADPRVIGEMLAKRIPEHALRRRDLPGCGRRL